MLIFDRKEFRALTALPPEIADLLSLQSLDLSDTAVADLSPLQGMTGMTSLFLTNTAVTDIAPLQGMTGMTWLALDGTPVRDLRPVTAMSLLADAPKQGGLTFRGTAAAQGGSRIAEIAEIVDPSARAQVLFNYLATAEPPGAGVEHAAPEQGDFLPVEVGPDGRLEVAASLPSEAERDERLKRVLHERLRGRAADLARMAGNQFFVLSGKARSLHERLDRDFAEVDLLLVHLDIGELTRFSERGSEREGDTPFPQELSDALADVVQDGPGLTLGNKDVEKLEERKRRIRLPAPEAHDRLSQAASEAEAEIGDLLHDFETQALADQGSRIAQEDLHRNMLLRIGRWVAIAGFGVGLALAANIVALLLAPR